MEQSLLLLLIVLISIILGMLIYIAFGKETNKNKNRYLIHTYY